MMRAYLGVSRNPDDREKTRNRFTDFDNSDNLRMYQLKQKPLHVVNVTLNLTGGEKLEWQDRRAESFTMSPLHCGSYWLGYRDSKDYALNRDSEGISLATAVAISGAAASPNMVCRRATFQTVAVPEKSRIAVTACATPFTRSLLTRIR